MIKGMGWHESSLVQARMCPQWLAVVGTDHSHKIATTTTQQPLNHYRFNFDMQKIRLYNGFLLSTLIYRACYLDILFYLFIYLFIYCCTAQVLYSWFYSLAKMLQLDKVYWYTAHLLIILAGSSLQLYH